MSVERLSSVETRLVLGSGRNGEIKSWTFTDDRGRELVRSSGTSEPVWKGMIATGGTVTVTVRWNGQDYPLPKRIHVLPRSGWRSTPVAAVKRTNGYSTARVDLTVTSPWPDGIRGAGIAQLDQLATIAESEMGRILDNGPNHGLHYVSSFANDTATFDWAIHEDIENPASVFWMLQTGTWVGGPQATCSLNGLGGNGGIISAENWRDGVRRHEGGLQNSHWSKYVDALASSDMNLKEGLEGIVSWKDVSASDHYREVKDELDRRRDAIYIAYASQPCGGECSADCLFWNGRLNPPAQQEH